MRCVLFVNADEMKYVRAINASEWVDLIVTPVQRTKDFEFGDEVEEMLCASVNGICNVDDGVRNMFQCEADVLQEQLLQFLPVADASALEEALRADVLAWS